MTTLSIPALSLASTVATPEPTAGATGGDAIVFGSGVPDPAVYPSALLTREFQRLLADPRSELGYSRFAGQASLRAGVARRLTQRSGHAFTEDDVLVAAGASGALNHVSAALIDRDDLVISEAFTYPAAVKLFRQYGAQVRPVPTDAEGMDPAGLEGELERARSEGRRVKFVYLIAPYQSPTTSVLSQQRAAHLVELARAHGTMLVIDDTYGEIEFGETSALHGILFDRGHSLHLGSFSKTLAPALRLGWVAGNRRVIDAIAAMRTDIGVSVLLQEAVGAIIASGEYEQHLLEIRSHYRRKRDLLLSALTTECAGLATWSRPEGSLFVWLQTRLDVTEVGLRAEQAGVGFVPGSTFAVAPGAARHLRLAYGQVPTDRLQEGARRLGQAFTEAAAAG